MASVSLVEHLRKFRVPKNTRSFLAAWASGLGIDVDCENLERTFRQSYTIRSPRVVPATREFMNTSTSGVFVHRAGKGAGKTENAARLFDEISSGIAIAPTRVLALDIAQRFGISYYLDPESSHAKKLALCVPSLCSKAFKALEQPVDLLFVDEASLLPMSIVTLGTDPWGAIDRLQQILNSARKVILADAWMSDDALEFFQHLTHREIFLVDEPVEPSTKKAIIYPETNTAYKKIQTLVAAGHRVAVACETVDQVVSIEALLKLGIETPGDTTVGVLAGDKYLGLHGMTLSDVKDTEHDVIIYTCSMGSGVSIINEKYKHVFLFYRGRTLTPQAANQMLGRFRNAEFLHISPGNNPIKYQTLEPQELPPRTIAEARQEYVRDGEVLEPPEECAVKARYLAKLKARWNTITSNARSQAALKLLLLLHAESIPTRLGSPSSADKRQDERCLKKARQVRNAEILDTLETTRIATPAENKALLRGASAKTDAEDFRLVLAKSRLHKHLLSRSQELTGPDLRVALALAQEYGDSLPLRFLGTPYERQVLEHLSGVQKDAWIKIHSAYPSLMRHIRVGFTFENEDKKQVVSWLTENQEAFEMFARIPGRHQATWALQLFGFGLVRQSVRKQRTCFVAERDPVVSEILTKLL